MHITSLTVQQFRCFETLQLDLDAPVVVIQGGNGSGKTSILEALHYLCYLRSFRTHLPKELVRFNAQHFFVKATGTYNNSSHTIQAGFFNGVRRVRLNQKNVDSYKELLKMYRVITVTEDDLLLIKQGPEHRRFFIDTALLLSDSEYVEAARSYRAILSQRNALLRSQVYSGSMFELWTEQLFTQARLVAQKRTTLLNELAEHVNTIVRTSFNGEFRLSFSYISQYNVSSFESFDDFRRVRGKQLYEQEQRLGRSCFGAHLDDIAIMFEDAASRKYASRGQQKLIVMLLKVALAKQVYLNHCILPVFLIDDFMTDFDQVRCQKLYAVLKQLSHVQLIFTSPLLQSPFQDVVVRDNPIAINLT